MVDLTKYSVPMLYSRSKNLEYKESIIEKSVSLLSFLKREGLIKNEPFDADGNLDMTFILRQSDLAPDGLELFKKAIPAWLGKLDRGLAATDVSYLEKALREIRGL